MAGDRIEVTVAGETGGWLATVVVGDDGASTTHRVPISAAARNRLAPDAPVEALVRASFEFLLEREPKESILREFEVDVISRYFPEYEREIRHRVARA